MYGMQSGSVTSNQPSGRPSESISAHRNAATRSCGPGRASGKVGSERGMCSQTDGPVPLGAFGLTLLLLGCTRIGTRRNSRFHC